MLPVRLFAIYISFCELPVMEQLTRLQTSCRAYRTYVTRILNKAEETLAKEIDELLSQNRCNSVGKEV